MRRELSGLSLDPSTRWTEAIKEAQYRNLTTPHKKSPVEPPKSPDSDSQAKQNWKRISNITRHAHGEPPALTTTLSNEDDHDTIAGKVAHKYRKHVEEKEKEIWKGKMMDLPYFLEMVDQKHRYGSSLRAYHAEWKKSNTHENFFYWLDHGEGKDVEISSCSRDRLEREQVRYLSREERRHYLIAVDKEGKLCWHKNNQRIDTTEDYRDSVQGIVPLEDATKKYREDEIKELESASKQKQRDGPYRPDPSDSDSSDTSSVSSKGTGSSISDEESKRYPDPPNFQQARGPTKIKTVSPHLILNRLMRTTVKKNTWIFVADTHMNLYVGIKQSGAFQHSSFLHGSRISAAGLIKIKRGQLRSLSPLSGHYRPPAEAFRHFVHHLKDQGVDMSRVSISKAYAVLVGLEAYMTSKQRVHDVGHKFKVGLEKVVAPDKARAREESEKDPSQSARLEEEKLRQAQIERGTGIERVLREVKEKVRGSDESIDGEGKREQLLRDTKEQRVSEAHSTVGESTIGRDGDNVDAILEAKVEGEALDISNKHAPR